MKRRRVTAAASVVVIAGAALLWARTDASYGDRSTTAADSLTTGTVTLGNSPTSAAIVASGPVAGAGPVPGSYGTTCVTTTYTGSLPADVRLYLPATGLSGLGPYLTLQIKEGTGGNSTCSGFTSTATLYNTTGLTATAFTVSAFSAASASYATGVSRWIATTGATRTYQFAWQFQDDNAATAKTASIVFTWEARST